LIVIKMGGREGRRLPGAAVSPAAFRLFARALPGCDFDGHTSADA